MKRLREILNEILIIFQLANRMYESRKELYAFDVKSRRSLKIWEDAQILKVLKSKWVILNNKTKKLWISPRGE